MVKSVWNFINYWYFRFLLVSELYMVEKWERFMMHIVFFLVFSVLSLFNTHVIVSLVSLLTTFYFPNMTKNLASDILSNTDAVHNEL